MIDEKQPDLTPIGSVIVIEDGPRRGAWMKMNHNCSAPCDADMKVFIAKLESATKAQELAAVLSKWVKAVDDGDIDSFNVPGLTFESKRALQGEKG